MREPTPGTRNILTIHICGRVASLRSDRTWACSDPVLRLSLKDFTDHHWPPPEDPMPARSLSRLLKRCLKVHVTFVVREAVAFPVKETEESFAAAPIGR